MHSKFQQCWQLNMYQKQKAVGRSRRLLVVVAEQPAMSHKGLARVLVADGHLVVEMAIYTAYQQVLLYDIAKLAFDFNRLSWLRMLCHLMMLDEKSSVATDMCRSSGKALLLRSSST